MIIVILLAKCIEKPKLLKTLLKLLIVKYNALQNQIKSKTMSIFQHFKHSFQQMLQQKIACKAVHLYTKIKAFMQSVHKRLFIFINFSVQMNYHSAFV